MHTGFEDDKHEGKQLGMMFAVRDSAAKGKDCGGVAVRLAVAKGVADNYWRGIGQS